MTDDTLLPFDLPAGCRKKGAAAFDGGLVSSNGGLLLLREAERRLGLVELLAGCLSERGGTCIGAWPAEGYCFNASKAVGLDGKFVGLALDLDVESLKTDERLNGWIKLIASDLGLPET